MGVSNIVKAVIAVSGKKQSDLIGVLEVSSKQALSNKFSNDRWTAEDLISVANFCGCDLSFITSSGQKILLNERKAEE